MASHEMDRRRPKTDVVAGLPTKAAKIRALDDEGYSRTEIRDYLQLSYQHVRNVLVAPAPASSPADRRKRLSGQDRAAMDAICRGLVTKSDKIRALDKAGYARADIARYLDIRYQHVRNVLVGPGGVSPQGKPKFESAAPAATHVSAGKGIGYADEPLENAHVKAALQSDAPTGSAANSVWARIGADGQIVIPVTMLNAIGVQPGDDVVVRYDENEVRVIPRETAIKRAQALVRQIIPEGVSLVDELIAERRAEATREDDQPGGSNG